MQGRFDHILDEAGLRALLEGCSKEGEPCWLVVIEIDEMERLEKRYGRNNLEKLIKWASTEIDFRIKRNDPLGFLSPGQLAILLCDESLEKKDLLRITSRFCRAIHEDQVSEGFPMKFARPMKQTDFDLFYRDWEGYTAEIGNRRIWWSRDDSIPKPEKTIGYRKTRLLDLKRRLKLLDLRITVSVGIARLHPGETSGNWLSRTISASRLASGRKGNPIECAE